jgi:hypothetical protein
MTQPMLRKAYHEDAMARFKERRDKITREKKRRKMESDMKRTQSIYLQQQRLAEERKKISDVYSDIMLDTLIARKVFFSLSIILLFFFTPVDFLPSVSVRSVVTKLAPLSPFALPPSTSFHL